MCIVSFSRSASPVIATTAVACWICHPDVYYVACFRDPCLDPLGVPQVFEDDGKETDIKLVVC